MAKILLPRGGPKRLPLPNTAPPAPVADYNVTLIGNQTADFEDASVSQAEGIFSRLWDFGDGQTSTLEAPTHTYAAPGDYLVTLTVTDANGQDDLATSVSIPATGSELSLPTGNQIAYWYAGNGVDRPASMPSTVRDGYPLPSWEDKSSNNHDLAETMLSAQPTWWRTVAALNNRSGVEFDGGDILYKLLDAALLGNLDNYNMFLVGLSRQAVSGGLFLGEGKSLTTVGGHSLSITLDGVYKGAYGATSDGAATTTGTLRKTGSSAATNNGAAFLLTIRHSAGTEWSLRVNGVEEKSLSVAVGTMTLDRLLMGAYRGSSMVSALIGMIAAAAMYSDDAYASVEPLLAGHYGINLP